MRPSNKKIKIAVYSLLAIFAVFLGYIEYKNQDSLQGFLLNLATELIGAVFIFVLIEFFFIDKDEEIYDRVISLEKAVQNKSFTWDGEIDFDLDTYLQGAKELFIVGYNLQGLLKHLESVLPEAIMKGLKAKILTLDLDHKSTNPAYQLTFNTQRAEVDKGSVLEESIAEVEKGTPPNSMVYAASKALVSILSVEEALASAKKVRGTYEHRTLSWVPSCSMIIIVNKRGLGKAKIVYNPPSEYRIGSEPLIWKKLGLKLDEEIDAEKFKYFKCHFDLLWDNLSKERKKL